MMEWVLFQVFSEHHGKVSVILVVPSNGHNKVTPVFIVHYFIDKSCVYFTPWIINTLTFFIQRECKKGIKVVNSLQQKIILKRDYFLCFCYTITDEEWFFTSGIRKSLTKTLLPSQPTSSLSTKAKMIVLSWSWFLKETILAISSSATTPLPLSSTPGLVGTVSQWAVTTTKKLNQSVRFVSQANNCQALIQTEI